MEKTKPFNIISLRFNISNESAKYFLGRVQKSFSKDRPSHQLIMEFMSGQDYESLPMPHQVATRMNESGVWTFPLNAEPATLVDEGDID